MHHFTPAEMIAAAIRTELAHLFEKVRELIRAQPAEPLPEHVTRSVVTSVRRVFATLRPFQRNAQCVEYSRRCAVCRDLDPELFADLAGFACRALAAARASGRAFENRINERATDGFVRHLVRRQVE